MGAQEICACGQHPVSGCGRRIGNQTPFMDVARFAAKGSERGGIGATERLCGISDNQEDVGLIQRRFVHWWPCCGAVRFEILSVQADQRLLRRMRLLQFIQAAHLDVPTSCRCDSVQRRAQEELQAINRLHTPVCAAFCALSGTVSLHSRSLKLPTQL